MPRPKKPGGPEPKTRSRNGCWPCKNRKIKCGEEKPQCLNCERAGEGCDYSIRLNWEGRTKRKAGTTTPEPSFVISGPSALLDHETASYDNFSTEGRMQRPPMRHSESQGSNRSLESIEDYKRKLQFTPETPSTRLGEDSRTPSWIDPNLPNLPDSDHNRQSTSPMPRSPGLDYGGIHAAQTQGPRDNFSAAQLSRIRDQGNVAYPSPNSNVDSPPANLGPSTSSFGGHAQTLLNHQMPPPFQGPFQYLQAQSMARRGQDDMMAIEHSSKRIRLSPPGDAENQPLQSPQNTGFGFGGSGGLMVAPGSSQASYASYSPSNVHIGVPPTPTGSSNTSDDAHNRSLYRLSQVPQESPDLRRLSVKSLLSDDSPADSGTESASPYVTSTATTPTISYGIDRGFPDRDLPNNNDSMALNGMTPAMSSASVHSELDATEGDYFPPEFGFGLYGSNSAHEQGGYYAKPVTVTIPKGLTPLPATLQDNPMNLLYFHHFLNHTARILVPHDCSANPFKSILPQMAIGDMNLLHLLLAYSASHRALLLKHPEPANRIALWVKDVFPTLRRALDEPNGQISNSNLATAIMLASLEIISPNAFEVTVPWQTHLTVARRMILARGGAESIHRKDKVLYFLCRWFAYLDILGSLSGAKNDQPLFSGSYWNDDDSDGDFQIDCLLGFTSRCVGILAQIAELARQCDDERVDSLTGNIDEGWIPTAEIVQKAEQLKIDLQNARMHRYRGCPHRPSTPETSRRAKGHSRNEDAGYDLLEMVATNEAFHWAGLIHLNRRILGKRSEDLEVQIAVREIVSALYKVRKGGTAEACLLFPMFTAGCDAREPGQRSVIMERLRSVEGSGMTQVHKARTLIEKVWETGRSWETLTTGEFFG